LTATPISDYGQTMDAAMVAQVRRFNRTVTRDVGALNDGFLGWDRSLGESRLLWEIGSGDGEVRSLRTELDLDSGYVSRLLRSLERDGLVTTGAGAHDQRVRVARLTDAGEAERRLLDSRSDALAAALLEHLNNRQRRRLVEAMAEVERLLTAATVRVAPMDPTHPHARHCLQAYFAELDRRFELGFDPADSNPAEDGDMRPPAGAFLVATLRSQPVGCGALKFHGEDPAEIKRMWVDESARGLGLGRRLLSELEAYAGEQGVRHLRLETNKTLVEAIALYRSCGYVEVGAFNDEPYAHHWFEKRVGAD
jgi:DNA-binding MarR family transcriptional regulator/GNAT superfamily N-acetyltransferase